MPDQPLWIEQVPKIIRVLHDHVPPGTLLDRAAIERLFTLSPRQANRLMQRLEGLRIGRSVVIPREVVVRHLQKYVSSGVVEREVCRKAKVQDVLGHARTELQRRSIPIPVAADVYGRQFADLPAGIQFLPGRLEIQYLDSSDLLQKLFELSQAIANDLARFEAMTQRE